MNDTITFQQIVIGGSPKEFTDEVNRLLMDGWRVVPGTFHCTSIEAYAKPTTREAYVTPRGTVFLTKHFIALERTETKASPFGDVDQTLAFQPMRKS